ncbi:hydroxymethylglutaryl-CoA lyase [Halomonas urumqiensis]|uniref:hydroxymethylglutaryl-CoA lyase n=1 Tax=Halomonas urumqiensis TaxID=1684789 RepID=A0A2N7UQP0_9GAMM|nr:hydroxymethylglutaryl-CoA lyase [Halomonas urumqiensis]PMR82748.1 hydroxymethylglutaryl-CoA lyase [Halomonas urumqiensis]PTB01933.1 hydroxymethylglutaryl-CoA lyase [Halomonas urumqiensis]GHE22042.1 3-hydroxy-3-isohexenylglutaryl-CoA/hydroxy-methylglutaryl-CoA lyase [Halomonas urumqiensis]
MTFPKQVRLVEVGPRDGLQNEAEPIDTATKLELIDRLGAAGIRTIEAASFVSPKWVPQMADHREVMTGLARRDGVTYTALTPNLKGLEAALECGVEEVAVFGAASEAFSQKNINCSVAESLTRFEPVLARARDAGVRVRGYVSCVLGCPYEGEIAPVKVADVSRALYEMGCYEISLGDTIGTGTPLKAKRMIDAVARDIPMVKLAAHFHDTYGQALANLYAVLEQGIGVVDSSVAGLGGCPYAKGASGNVASEDVVYLLNGLGIDTGIDLDALAATGTWITQTIGRPNRSKVGVALAAK